MPELLASYITNPGMYGFLYTSCAVGWEHRTVRALFLLNAAVQTIPEAALSAEGGALMAALVGKVKAAANLLDDLTLKGDYISETVFAGTG